MILLTYSYAICRSANWKSLPEIETQQKGQYIFLRLKLLSNSHVGNGKAKRGSLTDGSPRTCRVLSLFIKVLTSYPLSQIKTFRISWVAVRKMEWAFHHHSRMSFILITGAPYLKNPPYQAFAGFSLADGRKLYILGMSSRRSTITI